MFNLAKDVKAGKSVKLKDHLGIIESNNLKFWFKHIGLGSVEDVCELTGVKLMALKVRLKVHPHQLVSMCVGLSLIKSGYIDFDHESKMLDLIGIKSWLITNGYDGVDEMGAMIALDDSAVYRRFRTNRMVFVATAMGLKIVK